MPTNRIETLLGAAPLCVLALSGCSGGVDGPLLTSDQPLLGSGGDDALVSGVLTMDGNCLLLASDEPPGGGGYPVVWPAGTTWQQDPPAVVLDDGTVVPLGGTVSGGGGYWSPEDLTSVAPQAVADAASACVDETGTVALFQPGSAVTADDGATAADNR